MAGKEKRRYINYRVDAYLRDRFLQSGRKHKPREVCNGGEAVIRFFNHVKFFVVCCASLSQAVAPWMLCAGEVLTVLLIYFLATTRTPVRHRFWFWFTSTLDDVVGLSCTRAAIFSIAYGVGQRSIHRPYQIAAYVLAIVCLPYIVMKSILFRYGSDGIAAATILVLTGVCSILHILAARGTAEWARRRYQMGLPGFGMPWDEGEDAWMILRRPDLEDMTKTSDGGGPDTNEDVPAEMLADDDSKFVELSPGLKVHYKEVAPSAAAAASTSAGLGGPEGASTGIVLVHGFGGGVFSWRNVMEKLAMQCHCRVVAFDRPAFGLTSRPKASEHSNPYTVSSQSQLLLQFCTALGLRHVVLVAHADGCLVTLRAAAMAASHHEHRGTQVQSRPACTPMHPMHAQYAAYAAARAAEHARTAPPSADSSPKLLSSPPSPATEQHLAGEAGDSGGGAASSSSAGAGGAAAAGSSSTPEVTPAGPSGLQPLPAGPAAAGGGAAAAQDWEVCRSVVVADEVARTGPSGLHLGAAAGYSGAAKGLQLAGSHPSGPAHHAVHLSSQSCCAAGGSSYHLPLDELTADLEQGASAGLREVEGDFSAPFTSSLKPAHSQAHHRRAQSVPGPVGSCCSTRTSEVASCGGSSYHHAPLPHVLGLVLLHPNLSGVMGPAFSRILARSQLGRSILRPLLRTEVGEIANRRAWHNTDKLTSEVLELYKTPLRVEGWDAALIETTRQRREDCQGDLTAYCNSVQLIPTLIATGEHDRIVPPGKTDHLAVELPHSRVEVFHGCGHLSHEEAPGALLEHLVPFCGQALCLQGQAAVSAHGSP